MSIIYDILLVVIFLLVVWRGWRRGALSTLLWLGGWIAALIIIGCFGGVWAESIYSGTVEPWAVHAVEKAIPSGTVEAMNSGADAVDSIQNVLDDLSGLLGRQTVTVSEADAIQRALRQDSGSLASSITDSVLKPVLRPLVRDVLYAVILIVVLFVFRILSRMAASRQGSHGVLSRANHLLGGVLGVLEAMAAVYAAALVLRILANTLHVDWLTPTMLTETYIVSRLI